MGDDDPPDGPLEPVLVPLGDSMMQAMRARLRRHAIQASPQPPAALLYLVFLRQSSPLVPLQCLDYILGLFVALFCTLSFCLSRLSIYFLHAPWLLVVC